MEPPLAQAQGPAPGAAAEAPATEAPAADATAPAAAPTAPAEAAAEGAAAEAAAPPAEGGPEAQDVQEQGPAPVAFTQADPQGAEDLATVAAGAAADVAAPEEAPSGATASTADACEATPPQAAVEEARPLQPVQASGAAAAEIRIRFYIFNMANSSELADFRALTGLHEGGGFDTVLTGPCADGRMPDVVSLAMPEIPSNEKVTEGLASAHGQRSRDSELDSLVVASATSESAGGKENRMRGLIESFAGDYNGDLKTVLAFAGSRFSEDKTGALFGLFQDIMVGPLAVPNPKKSFMGRSLSGLDRGFVGYRFCFAGAHFPITKLSGVLDAEDPSSEPLESAKRIYSGILRNILRKARARAVLGRSTILFVQGDLNSRSMLIGNTLHDVLLEVLADDTLQGAITHDLGAPPGRWYEVCAQDSAGSLPATYKFDSKPSREQVAAASAGGYDALRLGDIMEAAAASRLFPNSPEIQTASHSAEAYKKILVEAGEEFRGRWGIKFKEKDFKNFRFPSCTDRVIYWAPDGLASRMSWSFPDGGHRVRHSQGGSDHRPVLLDAVLRLAPAPPRNTAEAAAEAGQAPPVAAEPAAVPSHMQRLSVLLDMHAPPDEDVPAVSEAPPKPKRSIASVDQGWFWTPDRDAKACEVCQQVFTVLRRRHHCRNCGRCVCSRCSPPECMKPLPDLGLDEPQLHCLICDRNQAA